MLPGVQAQAGVQAGELDLAEAMVGTIAESQVGVAMLAATVQLELSGSEAEAAAGVHTPSSWAINLGTAYYSI